MCACALVPHVVVAVVAVVAVTVMRVLFFVGCEYAERVQGSEGDGNTGMGDGGGVVALSAEHEYVGGTCGPGLGQSMEGWGRVLAV